MSDLLIPLSMASIAMFGLTLYYLSFALLSTTFLWIAYLGYTISIIFVLHSIMFEIEAVMVERGRHLSRAVPKYFEYAYTAVVAGSLLQTFVYAPRNGGLRNLAPR